MVFEWSGIIGVASLLLAIIGIIITYMIYQKQRTIKKLSITPKKYIIFEKRENLPDVQLIVGKKKVDEAKLLEYDIEHIGNKSIEIDDFVTPIEVQFNEDSYVLLSSQSNQSDDTIKAKIKQNENSIEIAPPFLNPNDSLSVSVIINNFKTEKIVGKIKDGSLVIGERRNKYTIYSLKIAIGLMVLMLASSLYWMFTDPLNFDSVKYIFFEVIVILLFIYAPMFWDQDYRKRMNSRDRA